MIASFATILITASSLPPHWNLQGHRAVVTGGSKGLGRSTAPRSCLAHGCEVLTRARDVSPLASLLADERCTAVQADVSLESGRGALLDAMRERWGDDGIDILVNNVGTNLRKPSVDYTEAEYDALQATNLGSAFHLSARCLAALKRRRGCVINMSSVSGSTTDSTGALYHMHKAALEHMTRYLACEWGEHGVRVNAVAPWFINTPLTAPLPRRRALLRRGADGDAATASGRAARGRRRRRLFGDAGCCRLRHRPGARRRRRHAAARVSICAVALKKRQC